MVKLLPEHRILMSILLFCNHLDGEERAGCFTLSVFLVSRDCMWLFLSMPRVFVSVVFPDYTHYLFLIYFFDILVLREYWVLTESRILLNPVLGGG